LEPAAPFQPAAPSAPVAPLEPEAPIDPATPLEPAAPLELVPPLSCAEPPAESGPAEGGSLLVHAAYPQSANTAHSPLRKSVSLPVATRWRSFHRDRDLSIERACSFGKALLVGGPAADRSECGKLCRDPSVAQGVSGRAVSTRASERSCLSSSQRERARCRAACDALRWLTPAHRGHGRARDNGAAQPTDRKRTGAGIEPTIRVRGRPTRPTLSALGVP